jgi:hypothetical protein
MGNSFLVDFLVFTTMLWVVFAVIAFFVRKKFK